ncbi:hypothetical protein [Nocardia sp. NPDC006630]|uniref:hypothetical protein n=1 Tax=Nocardia sp. NPDC006630 TaxID=3157181 RepID=UPI0033A02F8A
MNSTHRIRGAVAGLALAALTAAAGPATAEIPLQAAPVDTTPASTSSASGSATGSAEALFTLSAAEQAAGLPDLSPLSAAAAPTPLGALVRALILPIIDAVGSGGCASPNCGNMPGG